MGLLEDAFVDQSSPHAKVDPKMQDFVLRTSGTLYMVFPLHGPSLTDVLIQSLEHTYDFVELDGLKSSQLV